MSKQSLYDSVSKERKTPLFARQAKSQLKGEERDPKLPYLVQGWDVGSPGITRYNGIWNLPEPRSIVGLSLSRCSAYYQDENGVYRELKWALKDGWINWYVMPQAKRASTLVRYAVECDDWISLLHIMNVDSSVMLHAVYQHIKESKKGIMIRNLRKVTTKLFRHARQANHIIVSPLVYQALKGK